MSWIAVDYKCWSCGKAYDTIERRPAPDTQTCAGCGGIAEKQMPAPYGRVKWGEVLVGRSEERPPNALDTRPIARRAGVDV